MICDVTKFKSYLDYRIDLWKKREINAHDSEDLNQARRVRNELELVDSNLSFNNSSYIDLCSALSRAINSDVGISADAKKEILNLLFLFEEKIYPYSH